MQYQPHDYSASTCISGCRPATWTRRGHSYALYAYSCARLVHGIAIVSFGTRPEIAGRRIAITLAIVAHFQTSKPNSIGIVIKHNITLYLPSPQRRICAIIIAVTPLRLITALPMVLVPLMNVNKPRSGHTFIHFSILIFLSIVIHPLWLPRRDFYPLFDVSDEYVTVVFRWLGVVGSKYVSCIFLCNCRWCSFFWVSYVFVYRIICNESLIFERYLLRTWY